MAFPMVNPMLKRSLDTILVHPREVFKPAIAANAAAIVLAHKHPSGDPSPSEADNKVTRDLIRAGQLLKIEVLDHVILGRASQDRPKDYASLRELDIFTSFGESVPSPSTVATRNSGTCFPDITNRSSWTARATRPFSEQ